MTEDYEIQRAQFLCINLSGSPYDAGYSLGEFIKGFPGFQSFLSSGSFHPKKSGFSDFNELLELYETYCPGISDELHGFSECLSISPDKVPFFGFPSSLQSNCSQLVTLPSVTADKQLYIARSYEWKMNEEDKILVRTDLTNKYSHLGLCMLLFGRYEGMNSQGLVISSTGGGAYDTPVTNKKSFFFPLAVRALLEQCASVNEALPMLLEFPVASSTNFLLVDTSGHVALAECADSTFAVKELTDPDDPGYLISTNHPTLPEMDPFLKYMNTWIWPNSKTRYKTSKAIFDAHSPSITKDHLRKLLSTEFPNGVMAHYHSEYFGTVYSILFDPLNAKMEICFGPPSHNQFMTFQFSDELPGEPIPVKYIDKPSTA